MDPVVAAKRGLLLLKAKLQKDPAMKGLVEVVDKALADWGRLASSLETALIWHGYRKLTFQIRLRRKAVWLRFVRDPDTGWIFKGADAGEVIGWGFRWEYDLEKHVLIERKKRLQTTPISP